MAKKGQATLGRFTTYEDFFPKKSACYQNIFQSTLEINFTFGLKILIIYYEKINLPSKPKNSKK